MPKKRAFSIGWLALAALVFLLVAGCTTSSDTESLGRGNDTVPEDGDDSPLPGATGLDLDDDDNDNDDDDDDDDDDDNDDDNNDTLEIVPLTDDQGRTLILHGANYMGMEFGWFGHQAADFEQIASWGFNVVRLPIAWSYLEPEKDVYDLTYLSDHVEPAVACAAAAGLKVILDMHQWNWSPCSKGNGAPAWTCDTPTGSDWDWIRQAHLFWDHPEYLDHLVGAWGHVAQYFSGDDRIWGYDLFNEPNAGLRSLPWTCEKQLFRPLYIDLIEAIRHHHPEPYILIEPSITHVAPLPFVMEPLPYERLIYAPHLYPFNTSGGGDYLVNKPNVEMHVRRFLEEATVWGIPMLIGETGVVSSASRAEFMVRDTIELFDEYRVHFTWWTFWRDDSSYGLLDAAGQEKESHLFYLERPYPRLTAGALESFGFDEQTGVFEVTFENDRKLLPSVEIFIPTGRHYPNGFTVESSDQTGWSWAFDWPTSVLTVLCDPAQATHTITVTPDEI